MKDLNRAMNEDLAMATLGCLTNLFQQAGIQLLDYKPTVDTAHGTVVVNGDTFTYSSGTVRLLAYCPACNNEVPSRPIRRLADVSDQKRNFKPDRHECMDV